jgi:hypothetical protein
MSQISGVSKSFCNLLLAVTVIVNLWEDLIKFFPPVLQVMGIVGSGWRLRKMGRPVCPVCPHETFKVVIGKFIFLLQGLDLRSLKEVQEARGEDGLRAGDMYAPFPTVQISLTDKRLHKYPECLASKNELCQPRLVTHRQRTVSVLE